MSPKTLRNTLSLSLRKIELGNTIVNEHNINQLVPDIYNGKAGRDKVGPDLASFERPRIMKSHASYENRYPRVVYLIRDGRDVAVSYYNYYQTIKGYGDSFDTFLKQFLQGKDIGFGSWQDHVRSWLSREHTIPFLILKYEQLHENPNETLGRLAAFLHLDTDETRSQDALQKCTFESYVKDVKQNSPFSKQGYRGGVKGRPGAWKELFTQRHLDLFWSKAGKVAEELGYHRNVI